MQSDLSRIWKMHPDPVINSFSLSWMPAPDSRGPIIKARKRQAATNCHDCYWVAALCRLRPCPRSLGVFHPIGLADQTRPFQS